jgi:hypothetical protein
MSIYNTGEDVYLGDQARPNLMEAGIEIRLCDLLIPGIGTSGISDFAGERALAC